MAGVSMITVRVKLTPSPEQARVLESTLRTLNDHANQVSRTAHETGAVRNFDLRKRSYRGLREAGVGSQAAQHVIKSATRSRCPRVEVRTM
jgi:hypothetical protein